MGDPLLEWLKERLYADRDVQGEPPGEDLSPELKQAVEESWGAAHEALELWRLLRQRGVTPPWGAARQVLGVIVEIGFPDGTDVVAAFADGSSQFFSRAGAALLGEDPRAEVEAVARRLISVAGAFVKRARYMEVPREPPGPRTVQFTFLTPSGPLVSTSSKEALRDGRGELSPLFEAAAELIQLKVECADSTA